MRILQVTPGSGQTFYCENCLRDAALVRALRRAGHDAAMVPMYLPPEPDGAPPPQTPIFFGAVNVYLQQASGLFRRTPRWVDRLFDARWLLRAAGKLSGSTDASELGEMTLSMLRGEHGRQVKELDRLVAFLERSGPVDVVCLSNALLIGLARKLRERLGAAVVCMLQDEDEFLDALGPDDSRRAWELLADRADDVDLFVSPGRDYAGRMTGRLALAADRVRVARNPLELEDYAPAETPPATPTIGYLSRMCRAKGLDLLVEALAILRREPALSAARIVAAGGMLGGDRAYVDEVKTRIAELGLSDDVELRGHLDRPGRLEFLRSLSVLSVPTRHGEAAGRYALEALACGVPVVQPTIGVFPEMIDATGGGLLCAPDDAVSLADTLRTVLTDAEKRDALASLGRAGVRDLYDADRCAAHFAGLCRDAVEIRHGDER